MRREIKVYENYYQHPGLLAAYVTAAEQACPEIKGLPYRTERHENCLGPDWGDPSHPAYDPYYLLIWEA